MYLINTSHWIVYLFSIIISIQFKTLSYLSFTVFKDSKLFCFFLKKFKIWLFKRLHKSIFNKWLSLKLFYFRKMIVFFKLLILIIYLKKIQFLVASHILSKVANYIYISSHIVARGETPFIVLENIDNWIKMWWKTIKLCWAVLDLVFK